MEKSENEDASVVVKEEERTGMARWAKCWWRDLKGVFMPVTIMTLVSKRPLPSADLRPISLHFVDWDLLRLYFFSCLAVVVCCRSICLKLQR